jgi:dihydrofolate reductase
MSTGTVSAGLTVSVDGYYVGPDDGPDRGLGVGGERLHYWVMGGPWTYDDETAFEASGADAAFLDEAMTRCGAVICGRGTYEGAGAWGGSNPWEVPLFVVTHRVDDQPDEGQGFAFVPDLETALAQARASAGDRMVNIMGGGTIIREALAAGVVDELYVSTAPVVLGRGKRLFEDFDHDIDLEKVRVWDSPLATHVQYRVVAA